MPKPILDIHGVMAILAHDTTAQIQAAVEMNAASSAAGKMMLAVRQANTYQVPNCIQEQKRQTHKILWKSMPKHLAVAYTLYRYRSIQ